MAVSVLFSLLGIVSVSLAVEINFVQDAYKDQNVTLGEIPYIVSLKLTKYTNHWHLCGGVILNQNYVITAAHCISNQSPQHLAIVAGSVDLEDPKITRKVVKIYVHENYNIGDYKNDICLLQVDKPFEFTKTVAPLPLPESDAVYDNKIAVIAGWGYVDMTGGSQFLKKTDIPIVSNKECQDIYKGQFDIEKSHMCTLDKLNKRGPCYGDDGGPLIVDGVVVGLFVWALRGCASTTYPALYTRLFSHIDWIREHAK